MTSIAVWVVFLALDVVCYTFAPFPERCQLKYMLPGGGIAALLFAGRT